MEDIPIEVWEGVVFVLDVLAFVLIGLQLRTILMRISRARMARIGRRTRCARERSA